MVDSPRSPATRDAPGTPRWVIAIGVAAIFVVLVVVVVMLTGAGGEHGPGRHTASAVPTARTPAASGAPSVGVGRPAEANEATRSVEVTTLDTMRFAPSSVDVVAGEAVTFVVTNAGQAVHEFTLGDAAMQQDHAGARAHIPAGVTHELPNSITVQPGETKQLTWRFGGAGVLEYACHEPGHYEAGMRAPIAVS